MIHNTKLEKNSVSTYGKKLFSFFLLVIGSIFVFYAGLTRTHVAYTYNEIDIVCGYLPLPSFKLYQSYIYDPSFPYFFRCIQAPLEGVMKPMIGAIINPLLIFLILLAITWLMSRKFAKKSNLALTEIKMRPTIIVVFLAIAVSLLYAHSNDKQSALLRNAYKLYPHERQQLPLSSCSTKVLKMHNAKEVVKDFKWKVIYTPNDSSEKVCLEVTKSASDTCFSEPINCY
jgi:hypothetical protein